MWSAILCYEFPLSKMFCTVLGQVASVGGCGGVYVHLYSLSHFVCVCVYIYRSAQLGSGPCCWGSSKYFDLKTFLSSLTEVVVIGNWKESTKKSLRFEEKHPKSCRHTTSVCCLFCRADYGFTTSLFSR